MKYYFIILLMVAIVYVNGALINVPGDYGTIQDGITASVMGDTVLVQPGIYYENISFNGKNIVLASLYVTTHDTNYIYSTVIDGNHDGAVVIFANYETSAAKLCGFTITNGYNSANIGGGGIYINTASPTLENLIIRDNTSDSDGGGIYCWGSTLNIYNSKFYNNTTNGGNGGGLYFSNGTINIEHTEICYNHCNEGSGGGGLSLWACDVVLDHVKVYNNHTTSNGGGILIDSSYNIATETTEVYENSADLKGGGLYLYGCNSDIGNMLIHHNTSGTQGGGIYTVASPHIVLYNLTIVNNEAPHGGAGIGNESGGLLLVNSIVYHNTGITSIYALTGWTGFAFCDIEDFASFSFVDSIDIVIDADPLFVAEADSDYHLLENSPCVDSGTDGFYYTLATWHIVVEIMEFVGEAPDMGALEYGAVPASENDIIDVARIKLQCYPNPFNPQTSIRFELEKTEKVDLRVYNLKGELIKVLKSEVMDAGEHLVNWNGRNSKGNIISSGIYLMSLQAGTVRTGCKVVMIK
ncbi:MAG: T9SS type A sorting domain-containing protein [Candidatus Cloacimonetes bacterium]|nr:T9SS type A sorting domain-containing protein [Candidatus Cloacimonadota bacterium]